MKVYLVWAIELDEAIDTTDRDSFLEKFPNPAVYGSYYLFPASYDEVANLSCEKVDLTVHTLVPTNEDKQDESDISEDEFIALHDQLTAQEKVGRCVILSSQQGKLLRDKVYPVTTDEEVI
ncbi:hypothetical protein [Marisediminitalea sp.]|uniref:hypothetical protein n=1 Tax=Marisediminitalea sp. TaxID=2662268 RepID=UPI0035133CEA